VIVIVAILIILPLSLAPGYVRKKRIAQQRLESIPSKVINTTHGKIEYVISGEGLPIIVSHGITGGVDQGLGMAESFLGEGFQTIAISRYGYLNTPLPDDPLLTRQADAYAELLDQLNIKKAAIFGNSAGGLSAIQFAIQYPERCYALILVASTVPGEVPLPPKPIMRAVFGSDFVYYAICNLFKNRMISMVGVSEEMQGQLPKERKEHIYENILLGGLPITSRTPGVLNDMYVSNPDINSGYDFEKISVPTLMVHAIDDPLIPIGWARAAAGRIPNSLFVEIKEGGHIFLNHEREVKSTIKSFLEDRGSFGF
jgi:pimeloyl-ACP methyl ester carboxylesterase